MAKSNPVQQHADTIAELHNLGEERAGAHQRGIEFVTSRLGRPLTLYALLVFLLGWIGWNLASPRLGMSAWDPPPFSMLGTVVSVLAVLLTTVVLVTQSRQIARSERRAQLDLHLNLLIEQRTAKLVALLEELRRDSPSVQDRKDPEAEALQKPADARDVLAALEDTLEAGQEKS